MIQRIQTVYLLIAGLSMASMFVLPITTANLDVLGGVGVNPTYGVQNNNWLLITCILITALCLIAVGLFRNRPLQIKIAYLIILSTIGMYILIWQIGQEMNASIPPLVEIKMSLGMYMPGVTAIMAYFASSAIKKDDQLVKSADRLR